MRRAEPGQAQARTLDIARKHRRQKSGRLGVRGASSPEWPDRYRLCAVTSLGLAPRHAPQYLRGGPGCRQSARGGIDVLQSYVRFGEAARPRSTATLGANRTAPCAEVGDLTAAVGSDPSFMSRPRRLTRAGAGPWLTDPPPHHPPAVTALERTIELAPHYTSAFAGQLEEATSKAQRTLAAGEDLRDPR
jgi:hypothetical protein